MLKDYTSSQQNFQIKFAPFIFTIAVVIAFGSFNIGFSMVCTTMLEEQIKQINHLQTEQMQYYLTVITSMLPFGAMLGSFLIKFMSKMGENKIMVLTDILTMISSLMMISSLEIVPLCFSRFMMGIACGFSVSIIPRYLISISPLKWGGLMGSLHQILITIGIAFAFLLGQKVKAIKIFDIQDWQAYLIVPIFYSLVRLIVLNIFKFDSLQKYYEDGNEQKLKEYMKLFYNKRDIQELIKVKRFTKEREDFSANLQKNNQIEKLFGFPQKIIKTAVVLLMLNQLSGINAVLVYAKQLFMKISHYDEQKTNFYLLLLGLIQIFATITGGWLANNYGRKKILLIGGAVVSSSLLLVSLIYLYDSKNINICVILIFVYLISYAISIGPISMTYLAELLPDLSMILMIYWSLNLVASIFTQILLSHLGLSIFFLLFAMMSGGCNYFLHINMVQSQDKTQKQLINEYIWDFKSAGEILQYKNFNIAGGDGSNSLVQV